MSIREDIKKRFVRLSKGQRKVAQFVMDNPNTVIANGAAEVGRLANVSESTVIRFCYAMDLSGYVELQEEIRGYIMSQDVGTNLQSTYTGNKLVNSSFGKVMQRDSRNIQETIQLINDQQIQTSSKWMHEAENIYILGTREAVSIANWLSNTLKTLRSNIKQLRIDSDEIMNQINNMGERTTLIVLSFDQQLKDIQTIVEIAKMKKVKIIAITGTAFSPVREYANILFALGTNKHSSLDIVPVLFSFLHALLEEMINQDKGQYEKYQKSNEQVDSNILFLNAAREKKVF
ncbi:MurR/RpiR family transcriptional regulator [Lysinibacillus sp. fkY74-1]|uniref:MurR/RpiR family transcriptional regulator n=2 Tax=Bacillaceae TaxID=186817 RepID=A0ABT2DK07_9BACI|nr:MULTISPECIES: MurR/RpiR family transcriptional regulator [Lysinibacillus]MBE5085446.1 MurR/RpiR family transcriptional regulator [Bacillus thuringiensis]AMO31902.1 transcriptional regulator [Lysinibacillus sphaericus]AMR88980.1 transcriptional regulator [Lysinibacillus sphaericus]ANA47051.1 transcriptional regulator [Lysinibacillus sphaericus]KZL46463.1 transcriptional regulator [Lysinibacillus sphaericus]